MLGLLEGTSGVKGGCIPEEQQRAFLTAPVEDSDGGTLWKTDELQ